MVTFSALLGFVVVPGSESEKAMVTPRQGISSRTRGTEKQLNLASWCYVRSRGFERFSQDAGSAYESVGEELQNFTIPIRFRSETVWSKHITQEL